MTNMYISEKCAASRTMKQLIFWETHLQIVNVWMQYHAVNAQGGKVYVFKPNTADKKGISTKYKTVMYVVVYN